MAEQSTLEVKSRSERGTRACRKLRKQGQVPGNIYGHTEDPVPISADGETLTKAVNSGHKIVDVKLNGGTETTILREVQWNTFATEILHFDLMRIDANERVTVMIPIVCKGIAPGVTAGGILEQPVHEIEMEVLALEIPDALIIRISDMQLGNAKHVSDLELPPSAKVSLPPETLIVQVSQPLAVPEPTEAMEAGPAEPELIGRPAKEEEE
jgi:large subunit ribosomal protein L25